jgi:hypothetical protein
VPRPRWLTVVPVPIATPVSVQRIPDTAPTTYPPVGTYPTGGVRGLSA